jgi:hypothetical protein
LTHDERVAAIEGFRADGRHPQWIFGWWRFQMRHADGDRDLDATNPPDTRADRSAL